MEAAAKTVQLLTQRILPEKPHHLSHSPDWRHQVPADESRNRNPEEWDVRRLQYMTLVSEADRGVLLTRPYYDMRVDPPKPAAPRDVAALTKSGGEKKKLSLSDYKNKKTTGPGPDSTPEPPVARVRDRDAERAPPEAKPVSEMKKHDAHRSRESLPGTADSKPSRPRENIVDMRLPPKPPPPTKLPPRPMSPDSRKHQADDDELRLQKRARPEDRPRPPRDEPPRRRDRDQDRDQPPPPSRDSTRSSSTSLLPNGRNILKNATSSTTARNTSPAGRARGDSVNGTRPSALGNTKNTPTKSEGKHSLPPLLSPLHFSLDGHDAVDRGEKRKPRDERTRDDRQRDDRPRDDRSRDDRYPDDRSRDDGLDGARQSKPKKIEPPPSSRIDKSPTLQLPTLLSPTLPSALEEELLRRKVSSKSTDAKSKQSRDRGDRSDGRGDERREKAEKTITARKSLPADLDEDEPAAKERKKSLIVTLHISKRLKPAVRKYFAVQARKESAKPERATSAEAPPPPSQSKKRPASTSDQIADTIAVKRPRTSSVSSSTRLPPPPSTPSKKGTTAMSRVSSSNSQAHTPGDAANTATPSAPGSSERPPVNGTDSRVDKLELRAATERQARFSSLGRRLKHNGDVELKRSSQVNGASRGSDPHVKLGYVLTFESIIGFMSSFLALNQVRTISGKACDPGSWETLFPLVDFLQKELRRLESRRYQPLSALALLLHAVTVEEVIKCYSTFQAANVSTNDLLRYERLRPRLWKQVREAIEAVEVRSLRASVAPWQTVEEICDMALDIIRNWCANENVDWTPEVNVKDGGR